jgi:hypothetical protein
MGCAMRFVMETDLENLGTNLGPAMARQIKCGREIPHYFERRGAAANRAPSAKAKPFGMTSKIKCLTRDSSGQRT